VKLADFGLSKWLKETPELFNCAGTPGYIAPEILEAYYQKIPYGRTVDLWSTGVIVYILIFGFPPFWEEDQDEMFEKIRKADFFFPDNMPISDLARDFIMKLLTVSPNKRLTAEQALNHPWITGGANAAPLPDEFKQQLKKWNARRRLKSAINAVRALSKFKVLPFGKGSGDHLMSPAPSSEQLILGNNPQNTTTTNATATTTTTNTTATATTTNTTATTNATATATASVAIKQPKIQVQMSLNDVMPHLPPEKMAQP